MEIFVKLSSTKLKSEAQNCPCLSGHGCPLEQPPQVQLLETQALICELLKASGK